MSAYTGLGITQGAKELQAHERGRATREAQQAEAMNRRDLSKMQLNDYKAQAPIREQQNEAAMAKLKVEARQANRALLQDTTFSAFDRYEADGDVKHLNNMLKSVKKNPVGAAANTDIVRYDSLTDDPEIRQKMVSAGYQDFDGILADKQLNKSFVVTTSTTGEKTVWDIDKVYAASGYGKHMTNEKLEEARKRAQISELTRKGDTVSAIKLKDKAIASMMEATPGLPYHKAFQQITEMEKGGSGGQDLEAIKLIAEEEESSILEATVKYFGLKNSGKGQTDQSRFVDDYVANNPDSTREEAVREYKNANRSSTSKDISEADQYMDELDKMDYLDMDMSKLGARDRANIQRNVSKIENLLNVSLTTEDKRVLRDLNNLTQLGGVVGEELTPAETGIMDGMLNTVKKYIFDEVGGSKATSAYETFRNIFRNSLYGASLTATEVAAFNKAAGTLGEKFQPAMQRLNTQMMTVKNQLETIRNTNNAYVAKFYIGESIDNIDEAIRQIDSRIDMVKSYKPKSVTTKEVLDESWKSAFEDI